MTLSYNDNGVWRDITGLSYNDGGVWRTIQEAWYNDNGTWRKFFGAGELVNPLGVSGNEYSDVGEGSAAVQLNMYRNGSWSVESGNNGTLATGNWWSTAPQATVGDGYYVRFVLVSTSGSTNSSWTTTTGWLQMSQTRSAGVSAFTTDPSSRSRTATYNVEIATDANGTGAVTVATNVVLDCTAIPIQ